MSMDNNNAQCMPIDNLGMMKKEEVSSTLDGGWYMSSTCWPSLISSTLDEMYGHQIEDLARAHHSAMLRWPSWRRLRTSGLEHLAVHRHLLKGRRSSIMVRCSRFRPSTMVRCSQYCLRWLFRHVDQVLAVLANLDCSHLWLDGKRRLLSVLWISCRLWLECCVVDEVNICRIRVTCRCSKKGISCALFLACNMDNSWVVHHEMQSEARGEESWLWTKWDLLEATLGMELAEDLALTKFDEALQLRTLGAPLSVLLFWDPHKCIEHG